MAAGGGLLGDETWSVVKPNPGNPQGVGSYYGTPAAAALVAGTIALVLAKFPDWRGKPDLITEKLRTSAVPPAKGACDKPCGAGQLDAVRLLQTAVTATTGAIERDGVGSAARTAAAMGNFDGAWLLSEGEGLLRIEGSEWRHPDKGLATLSRDREVGEYYVTYHQHEGIKCSYRIASGADGKVLRLEVADATQRGDYCPSGKLLRAD
jgi:hypothetical protein